MSSLCIKQIIWIANCIYMQNPEQTWIHWMSYSVCYGKAGHTKFITVVLFHYSPYLLKVCWITSIAGSSQGNLVYWNIGKIYRFISYPFVWRYTWLGIEANNEFGWIFPDTTESCQIQAIHIFIIMWYFILFRVLRTYKPNSVLDIDCSHDICCMQSRPHCVSFSIIGRKRLLFKV